jgi:hypothetical protein
MRRYRFAQHRNAPRTWRIDKLSVELLICGEEKSRDDAFRLR